MKKFNMIYKICLFFALMYGAYRFSENQTEGFRLGQLTSSHNLLLPTYGKETEAERILSQKFRFMASGGQCYVFASEDGKYVLKFFKGHPPSWSKLFQKYRIRKMRKLERDMEGYLLAFESLQNECGLLFVRMNKQLPFQHNVVIVDKLGISYTVDLNKVEFVLQNMAEPLTKKNIDLNAIEQLIELRLKKGIVDDDPRIHQNIGLVEGKPIFLDPGRFKKDPNSQTVFSEKFQKWLDE